VNYSTGHFIKKTQKKAITVIILIVAQFICNIHFGLNDIQLEFIASLDMFIAICDNVNIASVSGRHMSQLESKIYVRIFLHFLKPFNAIAYDNETCLIYYYYYYYFCKT
jgi:hypothetical protein